MNKLVCIFIFFYQFSLLAKQSYKDRFKVIGVISSSNEKNNIAVVKDLYTGKTNLVVKHQILDIKHNIIIQSIYKDVVTIFSEGKSEVLDQMRIREKIFTRKSSRNDNIFSDSILDNDNYNYNYYEHSFQDNLEPPTVDEKEEVIQEMKAIVQDIHELRELRSYFEREKAVIRKLLEEKAYNIFYEGSF